MNSADIRNAFLNYFAVRGHRIVPSSPLVPANDPTLLFTNAGMVQFKDVFTGREQLDESRAVSAQRCVRAGGKHNDLENVGYTARHHTLFEMLGNFSFGDYFKRDAIRWAWELLTETLGLPPERLWITVHESDDEAARIWLDELAVDAARFTRMGDVENFWAMGDTGPCGPCSEIFYDHGPSVAGGPPGTPDEDGDRYVEIWNLVFMQYERDARGRWSDLPRPCVDTGMGLERIAAVLQGVHSNYDIDLFRNLIDAAAHETGVACPGVAQAASLRVIADHIRSTAFLITDGVVPSNEERGYVLRRIIRRALRHGYKLGVSEPFFHRLVPPLVTEMGEAYPELARMAERVRGVIEQEETQFARTLRTGMELLEQALQRLDGDTVPGEVVFRLYDTYGFPSDLTADIARERGYRVDEAGFERHMQAQRERARAASRFGPASAVDLDLEGHTDFSGYETLEDQVEVVALLRPPEQGGRYERVEALRAGDEGIVLCDRTPFYAEAGGQVGDTGALTNERVSYQVTDVTPGGEHNLHYGAVTSGELVPGERLHARVDAERRRCIALNHSATHLLHATLKQVLGEHVEQKGSLVAADRLRFDFSHPQPLEAEERAEIERWVNDKVWRNTEVETSLMSYDEAMAEGAVALFGEKYGNDVRVLSMGDGFSVELCGGTHVQRTGDIGFFRIIAESGVASGVRRIEAVTGPGALRWLDDTDATLNRLGHVLRASRDELERKAAALVDENRDLSRRVEQLESNLAATRGGDLEGQAETIGNVRVLAADLEGVAPKTLLSTLDTLKNRLAPAAVVLATVVDGKVNLIAGVTKDLTDRLQAGDLVRMVAEQVGAKGGGRADMARAGGGNAPEALPGALESVRGWVAARVN